MTEHKEKRQPQSRVKNSSPAFFIVCLIVAALLTGAFYFYTKKTPTESLQEKIFTREQRATDQTDGGSEHDQHPDDSKTVVSVPPLHKPSHSPISKQAAVDADNKSIVFFPDTSPDGKMAGEEKQADSEDASLQTVSPEQSLIADINRFYKHLDSQVYMKAYHLDKSSKDHFSSLLQKLLDNPPVVTRETDDLFTLLKNTAHFFRILGKDNILMLKGILDREKDSFENVLKSYYSLTKYPEELRNEYSLSIPPDSLYDYAGFFLNTMGGRLYLFRRDSTSRMTVSFYSILVIDRAKDADNDRHGLDLIQPINSLIEEIENAGNRLRLKEDYLDILYDLKEKYSY